MKRLWWVSVFLLVSCSADEVVPEKIIRPVRYQRVYSSGGDRVRTFSGQAKAGAEARLSFKVAGTVTRVAVKVGDKVDKGQVIAELDPSDFELQVQEAQAGLAQAQAQARNARAVYERTRLLYENQTASRSDLDAARAASETAGASTRSVQKRLALARRQLAYCKLVAPDPGSVASVLVEENENVNAGSPVVLLTSGTDIEVRVAVPEVLISGVRKDQAVEVTFDALKSKKLPGTVYEVGVASVEAATTFPVTVRLQGETKQIRSGMAAEVAMTFAGTRDRETYLVPPFAVQEDRDGRFVYVVEPGAEDEGTVARKPVKIGDLSDEGLEVFEGLADGDLLVTAGVSRIRDGETVRVLKEHEM